MLKCTFNILYTSYIDLKLKHVKTDQHPHITLSNTNEKQSTMHNIKFINYQIF